MALVKPNLSLSLAPIRAASGAPRRGAAVQAPAKPRMAPCRAAQEDATTLSLGGEWSANWCAQGKPAEAPVQAWCGITLDQSLP